MAASSSPRSYLSLFVLLILMGWTSSSCVKELEYKYIPDGLVLADSIQTPDAVIPDGYVKADFTIPSDFVGGCPGVPDCKVQGICEGLTVVTCENLTWQCDYSAIPDFEADGETLCDNLDNDCDGSTDEALTDITVSDCKVVGVCSENVLASCVDGGWLCDYSDVDDYDNGQETLCDNLDNDCDGETDEDLEMLNGPACPNTGVCEDLNQTVCENGVWTCSFALAFGYEQGAEVSCDNADNDCDGLTDEDINVSESQVCPELGVCAGASAGKCVAGEVVCDYASIENYEDGDETSCDGLDNDCDDETDENITEFPGVNCGGLGVCSEIGIPVCQDGEVGCDYSNIATYEADIETYCDNQDNDCDGLTDENIVVDSALGCDSEGICIGQTVRKVCVYGAYECDYELVVGFEAVEESCDGEDNDCDGDTDEEIFDASGTPIGCHSFGQCGAGVVGTCSDAAWQCDYTFVLDFEIPTDDGGEGETLCDGLDNDCDGITDGLTGLSLSDCKKVGVCEGTAQAVCTDAVWDCNYNSVPGYQEEETACDGLDNDCDGSTDEDITDVAESDCKTLGVCANSVSANCGAGLWYCDYSNVLSYQGNDESMCDGKDNDCDGQTDESSCQSGASCAESEQCVSNFCKTFSNGASYCVGSDLDCIAPLENGAADVSTNGSVGCVSSNQKGNCSNGTWISGDYCTSETPICVSGTCMQCRPGTVLCEGSDIYSCNNVGSGSEFSESCSTTENPSFSCFGNGFCAQGDEDIANTSFNDAQDLPRVGALSDGRFVATWSSKGQFAMTPNADASLHGVVARWYSATGEGGDEVLVNSYTSGSQYISDIAVNSNDITFIIWTSKNQPGGDAEDIYGRLYDGNGDPIVPFDGGEFRINAVTAGQQNYSSVTALDNDNFVVAWESDNEDGNSRGIIIRIFDPAGNPLTNNIIANTYTNLFQVRPTVSRLNNGGFVVSWASFGQECSTCNMGSFLQVFDSAGNPVGSETPINTTTVGNQEKARCVPMNGTQFVCTWLDKGPSGTTPSVKARIFENDSTPAGSEFNLSQGSYSNTLCTTDTNTPCPFPWAVKNGGFGVVFAGASSTTGQEIWTRRFNALGEPVSDDVQVNQYLASSQDQATCAGFPLGHHVCVWTSENYSPTDSSDAVILRMMNE